MKIGDIRTLGVGALGVIFLGVSALASAQSDACVDAHSARYELRRDVRGDEREIHRLERDRDRALACGHFREAREDQRLIDDIRRDLRRDWHERGH